ncbi:cupin domain-containing protein [Haloarchaeobius sp. DFWS5]|uniref:cupin domain-containing protein n=1 Tax=Haloarchaeobius sp. DFWS5 TaxID=3446114 RepID=UPI003EB70AD1
MGYHVVDVDSLEPTPDRPSVQKSVSDAVGLSNIALNIYEVEPGEPIPLAYHVHAEQEEALLVLSGTLRVETPEGEKTVEANDVFVAEPESPHRAFVPESASEAARVVAVGAPAVDDVRPYDPDDA